jgi:hypothetical protein
MGSNREKYHIPFDPYVINAYREFFNIELQYGVQLILGDIDLILDRQLVAPVLFLHVTLQVTSPRKDPNNEISNLQRPAGSGAERSDHVHSNQQRLTKRQAGSTGSRGDVTVPTCLIATADSY